MNRQEFFETIRAKSHGLSEKEIEERLAFYGEMIDDRMEEGCSEAEAIEKIGAADEGAFPEVVNAPLLQNDKREKTRKRSLKAWEIVLLVLGSPIWLSLLIAAFAVVVSLAIAAFAIVISVYAVIWSAVISLWAGFVALLACVPCGIVSAIGYLVNGAGSTSLMMLGVAIFSAGFAFFFYFLCLWTTKGVLIFTKQIALWIKKICIKKEKKQ